MKKLFNTFVALVLTLFTALTLVACGDYEVEMSVGDGNKEKDNVTARFNINEVLYDGYEMPVTFSAKKKPI